MIFQYVFGASFVMRNFDSVLRLLATNVLINAFGLATKLLELVYNLLYASYFTTQAVWQFINKMGEPYGVSVPDILLVVGVSTFLYLVSQYLYIGFLKLIYWPLTHTSTLTFVTQPVVLKAMPGYIPEANFNEGGNLSECSNDYLRCIFRVLVRVDGQFLLAGHGFRIKEGFITTLHVVEGIEDYDFHIQPALSDKTYKVALVPFTREQLHYEYCFFKGWMPGDLGAITGLKVAELCFQGEKLLSVITYKGGKYYQQTINSLLSPKKCADPSHLLTRSQTQGNDSGLPVFSSGKVRAIHYGASQSDQANLHLIPVPLIKTSLVSAMGKRKLALPVGLIPESPLIGDGEGWERAVLQLEEIEKLEAREAREGAHLEVDLKKVPLRRRSIVKFVGMDWNDVESDEDEDRYRPESNPLKAKAPARGRPQVLGQHDGRETNSAAPTQQSVLSNTTSQVNPEEKSQEPTLLKHSKNVLQTSSNATQASDKTLKPLSGPQEGQEQNGIDSSSTSVEQGKPVLTKTKKRNGRRKSNKPGSETH